MYTFFSMSSMITASKAELYLKRSSSGSSSVKEWEHKRKIKQPTATNDDDDGEKQIRNWNGSNLATVLFWRTHNRTVYTVSGGTNKNCKSDQQFSSQTKNSREKKNRKTYKSKDDKKTKRPHVDDDQSRQIRNTKHTHKKTATHDKNIKPFGL